MATGVNLEPTNAEGTAVESTGRTLAPVEPRRSLPNHIILHDIIIRALQMVLNAWKHYVKSEKKRYGFDE